MFSLAAMPASLSFTSTPGSVQCSPNVCMFSVKLHVMEKRTQQACFRQICCVHLIISLLCSLETLLDLILIYQDEELMSDDDDKTNLWSVRQ